MRHQEIQQPSGMSRSIWRRAVSSIFGAARRLHQYRDARDVLLQHVFRDLDCREESNKCGGRC